MMTVGKTLVGLLNKIESSVNHYTLSVPLQQMGSERNKGNPELPR